MEVDGIMFWLGMDERFRGRNLNKGDGIVRPVSRALGPHPIINGLTALRDWLVKECYVEVKPDSQRMCVVV